MQEGPERRGAAAAGCEAVKAVPTEDSLCKCGSPRAPDVEPQGGEATPINVLNTGGAVTGSMDSSLPWRAGEVQGSLTEVLTWTPGRTGTQLEDSGL